MSTYPNDPQNKWEMWFLSSIAILVTVLIIMTCIPSDRLPIWYDALTLAAFVNLVYCVIIGIKK